jgi:ribosomal protein L30E
MTKEKTEVKINDLPEGEYVIGFNETIKSDKIKEIVVANNCPAELKQKLEEKSKVLVFNGDQRQLGLKLGKPFFVAVVGIKK